ncbi:TonB family protein, partial [Acinetobacter baumannii]
MAERARETPPGTAAPGTAPRATVPPRPIASQSPPPRYPPQALRRGESGTVLVRVRVGADGTLEDVSIADSSG